MKPFSIAGIPTGIQAPGAIAIHLGALDATARGMEVTRLIGEIADLRERDISQDNNLNDLAAAFYALRSVEEGTPFLKEDQVLRPGKYVLWTRDGAGRAQRELEYHPYFTSLARSKVSGDSALNEIAQSVYKEIVELLHGDENAHSPRLSSIDFPIKQTVIAMLQDDGYEVENLHDHLGDFIMITNPTTGRSVAQAY